MVTTRGSIDTKFKESSLLKRATKPLELYKEAKADYATTGNKKEYAYGLAASAMKGMALYVASTIAVYETIIKPILE